MEKKINWIWKIQNIIINRRKHLIKFKKFEKKIKDYFHKKKFFFWENYALNNCSYFYFVYNLRSLKWSFFDHFQKWLCKKLLLIQGT